MQRSHSQILTIIPARMASVRLPGKPLADMAGLPMIVRVWQQAMAAKLGPVIIACAEPEIKAVIENAGGQAVLTDPDLPSGSDRVLAAARLYDPDGAYEIIMNLQGDMPLIEPEAIQQTVGGFARFHQADIVTAVSVSEDKAEINSPHIVKAVLNAQGRALYFSRSPVPYGARRVFHHIGLYAYRRAALERFCALEPSPLEQIERLEQLRALENDLAIYAVELEGAPAGIDTQQDLEQANQILLR